MKPAQSPMQYPGEPGPWESRHVERGQLLEVIRAFVDADGDRHQEGDRWIFLASGFDKFEDVMWLGLRMADGSECLMPLDWHAGRQDDVLEDWNGYVRPAK